MADFTIDRSGKPPLRFSGECLAGLDGSGQGGREHTRWHDIAVYRTDGGSYAVAIEWHTRHEGETPSSFAVVVQEPREVAVVLADYDPTDHSCGFPPHESYAEKQRRMLADLRNRYNAQVSEILASAPEFAEVVP